MKSNQIRIVVTYPPAELAAFMEDERKKWAEVVKAANIKIE